MSSATQSPEVDVAKGRRVTIDLTPAAAAEVDRLKEVTGLTTADIFRHAISLFRIYSDARARDQEFRIVDPLNIDVQTRIELPIHVMKRP
ncbi:MAG TPA: ribbon-helix-helix protein, CopG family [Pirellulales bacterium]|nr:ribbon-helix-helix protein, CopG family [Pirellulales bacterium]